MRPLIVLRSGLINNLSHLSIIITFSTLPARQTRCEGYHVKSADPASSDKLLLNLGQSTGRIAISPDRALLSSFHRHTCHEGLQESMRADWESPNQNGGLYIRCLHPGGLSDSNQNVSDAANAKQDLGLLCNGRCWVPNQLITR